jgi:hypothetical protein
MALWRRETSRKNERHQRKHESGIGESEISNSGICESGVRISIMWRGHIGSCSGGGENHLAASAKRQQQLAASSELAASLCNGWRRRIVIGWPRGENESWRVSSASAALAWQHFAYRRGQQLASSGETQRLNG